MDADSAALTKLPAGIYVQVYRAKVEPKNDRAARLATCDAKAAEFASLGARGIVWHGLSSELDADMLAPLTAICRKHGLRSLAAFGMDSSDPAGKGERIGRVLVSDVCDGVLLDAEGAWEDKKDGDDKAHAKAFADAFKPYRDCVPHKPVVDQPWAMPVRVGGLGGHSQFPYEEFAGVVDARAEQDYVNDFVRPFGASRYARCMPLFNQSWALLDARLSRAGLKLPRWRTVQSYGWDDIPADLADYLTRYASAGPVFAWAEPWPSSTFMRVWRELHEKAVI
jgi:hypothetical protein